MPKCVVGESADGTFGLVSLKTVVACGCEKFSAAARSFAELAKKMHGVEFTCGDGGVSAVYDSSLEGCEYALDISEDGAVIRASEPEGAFYAFASLAQLMNAKDGAVTLPKASITDKPECPFRTLMVDLARQWHPFICLKNYVDLCWLYKIKYLHLHFIDSQSYTLPSDVYPKLPTEGRSYTKAEIAELNEYAQSRGIELIPEIEVPGHAQAMVRAYPELFGETPIEGAEYTSDNIVCVGRPGVMDTIKSLTEEVIAMFPYSKYLHIGGDEAAIKSWDNCAECRKYMEENGINGSHELYTEFTVRMTDMVLSLGRTPIVWEGFPKAGTEKISRDVVVIAWESYYHLAPDLIEEGFDIINASWQPLYIVPSRHWTVENILAWNVYNWQHWWPKSEARLNPIHLQPTNQVMGGQLCAWECTYEQEVQAVRENLAALSERTWTIRRYADDAQFTAKLDKVMPLAVSLT